MVRYLPAVMVLVGILILRWYGTAKFQRLADKNGFGDEFKDEFRLYRATRMRNSIVWYALENEWRAARHIYRVLLEQKYRHENGGVRKEE